MDVGMLWFDNDPKLDLLSKVQKAAAHYRDKYGQEPNLCFVHPSMLVETKNQTGSVAVRSITTMLPHHFWIGVHHNDGTNHERVLIDLCVVEESTVD